MKRRDAEVLAEDPDVDRDEIKKMATTVRRRAIMTRDAAAAEAAEHLGAEAEAETPDLEAARRWWATLDWLR